MIIFALYRVKRKDIQLVLWMIDAWCDGVEVSTLTKVS